MFTDNSLTRSRAKDFAYNFFSLSTVTIQISIKLTNKSRWNVSNRYIIFFISCAQSCEWSYFIGCYTFVCIHKLCESTFFSVMLFGAPQTFYFISLITNCPFNERKKIILTLTQIFMLFGDFFFLECN